MDFFEFINENPDVAGGVSLTMGVLLLAVKIASIVDKKMHEKSKNSEFNDAAIWATSIGFIITGLKLILTNSLF